MFRKTIVAVAAAALVSTAALSPVSAKPFGGFGHHGGGLGFAIGALSIMGAAAAANSASDSNCLQEQFVQTPHGYYKKVIVNVCDQ